MDGNTLASLILFGPGATALPTIAVLWHRSNRQAEAERAAFYELPAGPTAAPRAPVPPTPGEPVGIDAYSAYLARQTTTPAAAPSAPAAPVGPGLAPVIDLTTRRRAA